MGTPQSDVVLTCTLSGDVHDTLNRCDSFHVRSAWVTSTLYFAMHQHRVGTQRDCSFAASGAESTSDKLTSQCLERIHCRPNRRNAVGLAACGSTMVQETDVVSFMSYGQDEAFMSCHGHCESV